MSAVNRFLLENNLRLGTNPCVSPDFCLDWPGFVAGLRAGEHPIVHEASRFDTAAGTWQLLENWHGDHAWRLSAQTDGSPARRLDGAIRLVPGKWIFPATFANLLKLKNEVQETDPGSTIFPGTEGRLAQSTLGIGARFTTLHWPAVEWAMAQLGLGLTANQNSIPRELVYDVDQMLAGRLDTVAFPFIGANVPEGHQGQSVEGMSHGAVLSKLKTGFHLRRIPWSFNADHQPVGGKFDEREDRLVEGSILASYITFDLSPELALKRPARLEDIDATLAARVRGRLQAAGIAVDDTRFCALLCDIWPSFQKMRRRDLKYREARARAFTSAVGRRYIRELSIDELPGLTEPETTAVMLALCEAFDMPVNFVAPAFGFQKNSPFPDGAELRRLIERQWRVCREFGVSIGFHSGSGKSAENYKTMGSVTGGRLEVKTSGRYTYEMGAALSESRDGGDRALWHDWYRFTVDMAVSGAFSAEAAEQRMARNFISDALGKAGLPSAEAFVSPESCRRALEALPPSPNHMFFFEYNFLFVLAAGGRAEKAALGDHSQAGYAQRSRFYSISPDARLKYAQRTAGYILFLAEHTGLAAPDLCASARRRLGGYARIEDLVADIGPGPASKPSQGRD
jgi:hypothetical protein